MDPSSRRQLLEQFYQEKEWRKCSRDWYYWLRKYVVTKDENDKENPFKRFPVDNLPYIRILGQLYLHQKLLIILKSRQLMVTWLCCALDLWEAMFHPGRFIPITAYKEEDAADIVDRIEFIYRGQAGQEDKAPGLPEWMQLRSPCKRLRDPNQLDFTQMGSLIRALAEGSDQGRGKTISRWRNEESRTQPRLEASSQAIIPTLKNGGGQAVYVSSAGPGYFQALVEDKLDGEDPPPKREYLCRLPGLQLWKNRRNGYYIVRIHYTADPAKRDPKWAERTKAGLAQYMWDQEYEIDFGARSGQPALPIFSARKSLIVIPPFDIPAHWPIFIAADYGTTNPYCALFFAVDGDKNLYVFWEYYSPGPLALHLSIIKAQPSFLRSELYALDRSCWAATQQASMTVAGQTLHSMRSVADLHMDLEVYPNPAHVVEDSVKIQACYREWHELDGHIPKTFIFQTCSNLIRELPGIRWEEKKNPLLNAKERLVDADNHAFDAFCYGVLYHREGPPTTGKQVVIPLGASLNKVNPAAWTKEEHEKILIMSGIAVVNLENERVDQRNEERILYGVERSDGDSWGLDD